MVAKTPELHELRQSVSDGDEDGIAQGANRITYFRSDSNGLIRYVNDAFSQWSDYPASELIGMAHRDMLDTSTPGIVAQLAWDRADDGQATGSYLYYKTRSRDAIGGFTLLLPMEAGCVCLLLAPKADAFRLTEELFTSFSSASAHLAGTSLSALTAAFRRCDYPGYDGFMACALKDELAALDIFRADETLWPQSLTALSEPLEKGMKGQAKLIRSFSALQLIPNNMRIIATRMEPAGGPISAISENYKVASMMITQRLYEFVGSDDRIPQNGPRTEGFCEHLIRHLTQAMILFGCIILLRTIRQKDAHDDGGGASKKTTMTQSATADGDYVGQVLRDRSWGAECRFLEESEHHLCNRLQHEVTRTRAAMTRLNRTNMEIRRLMLGLDTMRVLGRVECCRRSDAIELSTTIDHLDQFHAAIRSQLESVAHMTEAIDAVMEDLNTFAEQNLVSLAARQDATLSGTYSESKAWSTDFASELVQSASPMMRATS